MFNNDVHALVKTLIIEMLDLLCKCVSDHKKPPAEEALILFNLIEEDNFQSTPSEMRYPLSLVPIVSNYIIENSSDYRKFSRILLNDDLFNKFIPKKERGPIGDFTFPMEFLVSILWRYLNITKSLDWNNQCFDEIFLQSKNVWERGSYNIEFVVPLLGISGTYYFPEVELDAKWRIRSIKKEEYYLIEKIKGYLRLPAVMVYSAEALPIIGYVLACNKYEVELDKFSAGWNIIKPEFLPLKEIRSIISVLQAATSVGEMNHWFSIESPVVIYKTDEWAANPFGNPFSPCFSWPLDPCPIDREWFIPGKDWDKWLKRMYDFVNNADPGRSERYKNALRWFAKSIVCKDADERLVDLFIALNTLCCEEIRGRGIGITIGEFCSKRLNNNTEQQRKWRKYIIKAYEKIRNALIHEGLDIEVLNKMLVEDTELESADLCANMLEIAFRSTWNDIVLNG
jgi:hypothetical protein